MSKTLPVLILAIVCASMLVPNTSDALLPSYTVTLEKGINWNVMTALEGQLASSLVNSSVPWVASYNRTSGAFRFFYTGGHSTDFRIQNSEGFVRFSNYNNGTPVNVSGSFPYPAHYHLESGLSFHGNVAPTNETISDMLVQTTNCTWAAKWNSTSNSFMFYYPGSAHNTNFNVTAFECAWFFCSNATSVTYPNVIT